MEGNYAEFYFLSHKFERWIKQIAEIWWCWYDRSTDPLQQRCENHL